MVSRVKALPKSFFLIIIAMLAMGSLVVIDSIFGILPRQYEMLCEFSGGAGETTTESFHLERQGRVRLTEHVMLFPSIKVYRMGENQPLFSIDPEFDAPGLPPGDYYIVVEAGWGASWTIVVEEKV